MVRRPGWSSDHIINPKRRKSNESPENCISMLSKLEQPLNAKSLMIVTLFGMVMLVKLLQP